MPARVLLHRHRRDQHHRLDALRLDLGGLHRRPGYAAAPPPGPTFTDTFDRPDSPVLDNGWAVMTGSLMIQAGEGRNHANTTFSLAVQPDLVGATQTGGGELRLDQ